MKNGVVITAQFAYSAQKITLTMTQCMLDGVTFIIMKSTIKLVEENILKYSLVIANPIIVKP